MLTYSVWNNGTRRYDYFTTSEAAPIHAPAPGRRGKRTLGATPEEAAWRLPAGARPSGSGVRPVGRVASLGGDDGGTEKSWWKLAAGVAAIALWSLSR